MNWRPRSRTLALGGIGLMAMLATGTPVHVQAMDLTGSGSNAPPANSNAANSNSAGFNPYDPQWALAAPFGFNAAAGMTPGIDRQAFTTKFGSGTIGLFAATNTQDYGARAIGSSGNFFDPLPFSNIARPGAWFSSLGDSSWRSSFAGSYKSNANNALLNGLYTTASFGVTSFKTGPAPGSRASGIRRGGRRLPAVTNRTLTMRCSTASTRRRVSASPVSRPARRDCPA
jgi:hypothetical protein